MHAVDHQTGIVIELVNAIPALDTKEREPIFRRVRDLVRGASVGKVSYGTEASFFQGAGVPAMVCGPGSIARFTSPTNS